jgi:hypothetical protein
MDKTRQYRAFSSYHDAAVQILLLKKSVISDLQYKNIMGLVSTTSNLLLG